MTALISDDQAAALTAGTLDEALRRAAGRWPDRPALRGTAHRWTYRELDRKVSRRAAALAELGVRPGDRVGLVVPTSDAALATLAAVSRVGACLVPLDPATPATRVAAALADSRAGLAVVADPEQAGGAVRTVSLDGLGDPPGGTAVSGVGTAGDPATPGPSAGDLAYAIYTSGSTGEPKAVAVEHGAAAGHAAAAAGYFQLTPDDRVLQFASLGFDVAQEEIWPTWLAGAELVVRPPEVPDAAGLAELVRRSAITVLQLPTAYWRALLAAGDLPAGDFATVRTVVVGGEAATLADLDRWRRCPLAGAELINGYGPTECVVTATAYRWSAGQPVPATSGGLPIGTALPGRAVHLLDDEGRPVPSGQPGELYVSGLLARGYLGRPELTRQRFVTLPVDGQPRRLYRTGDLARELPGGDLEFLRRTDEQVKLRGYRIELGEIEAILAADAALTGAAAALVPRPDAEPQLAALVTTAPKTPWDPEAVRARAALTLPAHMVPAFLVPATRLPLTPSGKLDRATVASLLARGAGQSSSGGATTAAGGRHAAGADPTLDVLAELWREVLGVDEVGLDDDFYALGGDSLLVMRLTARARARGLDLAPAAVARGGTLRAVAAAATPLAGGSPTGPEPAGPLPLLPAQHRWLRDGDLPDVDHFVLNALLRVPPNLPRRVLVDAARALLAQHDVLRTRVDPAGTPPAARLADVAPDEVVEVVDLAGVPAGERTTRLLAELAAAQRTLRLDTGPVFRLVHLTLGGEPGRLLVLVHHLLLDGWSMALLVDDVDAAVSSAAAGSGPASLPGRTASVRAVAAEIERYLGSAAARQDARDWLAAPWPAVRRLPQDGQGDGLLPTVHTAKAWLSFEDTTLLLHGIPRGAPRPGALLAAALRVAVAEWSGQETVALDVYAHGRDAPVGGLDLSRTVGYLQATYPMVGAVAEPGVPGVLALAAADGAPARRYGFDALRFGSPDPAERAALAALPASPVRLNYRSQLDRLERRRPDSPLGDADEDTGAHRSARQRERYQLMFEGDVIEGRFLVGMKYSTDHYRPATADALAARTAELLAAAARQVVA
jgi:amino acid adenylation domain-containing protein